MGTKYTSQASAGYNASPPADDGSTTEANKVKWSTIKTKLADVLKTFSEAINSQLVTTLNTSARAISTSDASAATDHWRTIQVNTSTVIVTLADAATMAAGYIVEVANQSSGDITVALATATNTIDTVTNTTHTINAFETRRYKVNVAETGYITVGRSHPMSVRFTELATTSGTTKDFTIPSWANEVLLEGEGVSHDGTEELIVQIGDAGGIEATDYSGASETGSGSGVTNMSTGFLLQTAGAAAAVVHFQARLIRMNAAGTKWSFQSQAHRSDSAATGWNSNGTKTLSAALTTVRLTTTNTPDDFDAGSLGGMARA